MKSTLGPKGRNVFIQKLSGNNIISKDGVTVAREVVLEDPIENMGAKALIDVASRTVDVAGDGTTTATVLAQAIVNEGIEAIDKGANPVLVKRGIDKAVEAICEFIDKKSKKKLSKEDLRKIATISANGDKNIADDIITAMDEVGRDGVVTVQESKDLESSIEIVDGMRFGSGYLSPYFITNQQKMQAELVEPFVLLHKREIRNIKPLVPIIEEVISQNKALLIIAANVDGEALSTLVVNNQRGGMNFAAVKTPGWGDLADDILEDIGILTGATVFQSGLGTKIENANISMLGAAEKVVITKNTTTIVNGKGKTENIDSRIKQLENQIENTKNPHMKKLLEDRKVKLSGGIAVIRVGGASAIEVKEKKDRIDDALCATRAALEKGIVPGGGLALLKSDKALDNVQGDNDDENIGINIIRNILSRPLYQIASNSGKDGSEIIDEVLRQKDGVGYDALTDKYVNMIKSGIIDPTKVVIEALQGAASIASLLITTEAVISIIPQEAADLHLAHMRLQQEDDDF